MSRSHQDTICCSSCGTEQPFTVWESINVSVDPELKQQLLGGDLTTFICGQCGHEAHVAYDCLYHDMDHSLAIWLKEKDGVESDAAKQMFSEMADIAVTRTVRTVHELYDKIQVFDDDYDDFEIEFFKFMICVREQRDLRHPIYYSETRRPMFGRNSLIFAVEDDGGFEPIEWPLAKYKAAIKPVKTKLREAKAGVDLTWVQIDRDFIVRTLEVAGLMQRITP